ncbi:MAG: Eco29kI family restriction endonuclease [Burkholderiales bacterium]|nr:Eco29kI family restriction endonuclease [Burkholderiales bacterium]
MSDTVPYNPLDKKNLGASVAEALLGRKSHPLSGLPAFHGAGIYAIYYTGDFEAYQRLRDQNQGDDLIAPIYVGKAIPSGGRKGVFALEGTKNKALFNRLKEHAESITATGNLNIKDFQCRYLIVDDIWIPLGESLLIAKFAPIWNTLIDGFGNHNPGKGRHQGMRPRWDVLHTGRAWAEKCQPRLETAAQIAREVQSHLAALSMPKSPHFYVEQKRADYFVNRGDAG